MLRAQRAWSGGSKYNLPAWQARGGNGVVCVDRSLACELLVRSRARGRGWLASSEGCRSAYEY